MGNDSITVINEGIYITLSYLTYLYPIVPEVPADDAVDHNGLGIDDVDDDKERRCRYFVGKKGIGLRIRY